MLKRVDPAGLMFRTASIIRPSSSVGSVRSCVSNTEVEQRGNQGDTAGGFRALQLFSMKKEFRQWTRTVDRSSIEMMPDRSTRLPEDVDWPSVWPTAASFKASVVPLPVRMGFYHYKPRTRYPYNVTLPPVKRGNLELMKIPNFLHLTPPAIHRHCIALKKFCTEWPKELTDEACAKYFPVKISYSDYCHAGLNIRDPRTRIVTLKIKLSSLNFDERQKDKFIRLVGQEKYDPIKDEFILIVDRCPARHQNKEYAYYLLSVLFHESRSKEDWEDLQSDADFEKSLWNAAKTRQSLLYIVRCLRTAYDKAMEGADETLAAEVAKRFPDYVTTLASEASDEEILSLPLLQQFRHVWDTLNNKQENERIWQHYGELVRQLTAMPKPI